jgi:voltage-gated potassium channel
LAIFVLFALVMFGARGSVLLEGMSWNEAIYMTVITLTMVGFGEVQPLSASGRALTVLLKLLGVGPAAWAVRGFNRYNRSLL